MARRLFGDQATSSVIWFARESPVRQYMPLALDRTAPSERRINKLSTVNQLSPVSSGGSVGERPGARHANARRLEGDVVPSTTRAAPGPWPQVMTPAWSETHGPVSAPAGDAGAKTRSQSAARQKPTFCIMMAAPISSPGKQRRRATPLLRRPSDEFPSLHARLPSPEGSIVAAQLGVMEGGPAAIKAGAAEVRNGSLDGVIGRRACG